MPPYVSPLREAQAAQTRRRILDAAVAVFGASGYSGASLAQIAHEAGVSLETVKQNGPKAALLLASFDHAFSGAEGEGPIHARDIGADIVHAADAEVVPRLVGFVAGANARVARLWPRVLDASAGDAEVGARVRALQQSRRDDMAAAIALFRDRGLCLSARSDDELAAALSFLISPEGYAQLVLEHGWTDDAYRTWTVRAVERLVLED